MPTTAAARVHTSTFVFSSSVYLEETDAFLPAALGWNTGSPAGGMNTSTVLLVLKGPRLNRHFRAFFLIILFIDVKKVEG